MTNETQSKEITNIEGVDYKQHKDYPALKKLKETSICFSISQILRVTALGYKDCAKMYNLLQKEGV